MFALTFFGCPPTVSDPCDTDADCPDGRCRFGACGPICEEDGDCGSRQICQDGACVARPECAASTDCASGFSCQAGTCRCTSDGACALNQSCVQGVCQARERCTADAACPPPQRCELTAGLCLPPCATSSDCAPGVDPRVAVALYQCLQGSCLRRCVNDLSCGQGLICADGLCEAAHCEKLSDCAPGQYCTSATFGRCVSYTACASDAQCPPNFQCRGFDPQSCPPDFPCSTPICQELPRCLVDGDCGGGFGGEAEPAYCRENHCQPTVRCADPSGCAQGQACVGGLCVPGGCRGHADCEVGDACVGGACRTEPAAANISALALTPLTAHLAVGETIRLRLVGYELDGSSFPLTAATFLVLDEAGQPSAAAMADGQGNLTGVSPGKLTVRASLAGAAVNPVDATVYVHGAVAAGRRVTVVDASTLLPIVGVTVRGCDGPPAAGPCPSPVDVTTGPLGEALFPGFVAATADFSAAAGELRADGRPRYERVSVAQTDASDLLLPLWPNPVAAAAGFNATVSFNQVHSDGNYWIGFSALSAQDPADLDPQQLLGEPFQVSLPALPQRVPVPGSLVLYTSPGLGIPDPVKERSLGLGQPGRRNAVAFAGRTTREQLLSIRSTELLAYAGAFDLGLVPFFSYPSRPRVPDVVDVDGDGLCADAQRCPQGPEQVPDYFHFTQVSHTPRFEQARRTEVVLPAVPAEFDTAIVAAVEAAPETGLTPLGFTSTLAGPPGPTGERPLDPVTLRSGAAHGGVEAGEPGLWVMAAQAQGAAATGGSVSGRIHYGPLLPSRAVIAPLLPTAQGSSFSPAARAFTPGQPAWNGLVSAGGELARVDLVGTEVRHRVYFAAGGSQTQVRVPDAPPLGGRDPATEPGARLQVTVVDLREGLTARQALELSGPGLEQPALIIDGYSRWQSQ